MATSKKMQLITLGDSTVGKTSILEMYQNKQFKENNITTIGVEFYSNTYIAPTGETVNVKIWDTAGQDRFRSMTQSFYRQGNGVIMVFDITSENSFKNVKTWLESIYQHADVNIVKVLIGNKADLADLRQVSSEEARELAMQHKMQYFETSAKTNQNIAEAMNHICLTTFKKLYPDGAVTDTKASQGGMKLGDMTSKGGAKGGKVNNSENNNDTCGC